MGPVVGTLWYSEKQGDVSRVHREMNEAQLNTVGYVLSRYGALTARPVSAHVLPENWLPAAVFS